MKYTDEAVEIIKNGGVGVMPTDTIFGLVASAMDKNAVEKVYALKGRDQGKPCVVLISSIEQLEDLSVTCLPEVTEHLMRIWKEPVSIILPCKEPEMGYLHRNMQSLAIRLPNDSSLIGFIEKTGPVIATSVNKSGNPALSNISQIKNVFPALDFYLDGISSGRASRLARLNTDNGVEWISRV